MVAKVIIGKNIQGAIRYNEHKVAQGKALCLLAANFFSNSADELNLTDKFNQFDALTQLNSKTKTNALHISLNFDISEKISRETLCRISTTYMERIGFGDQPYLMYEHFDAAHQHVHLVTTNIQKNARRIDLHNIGRNQSEQARKYIESFFGLVPAESKKHSESQKISPVLIKAVYGKSETKQSISNILRAILPNYKYTSIHELNAVLKQFNIIADPGKEGTFIYHKKGLRYSLLDAKGHKIGVPIKASAIYDKPTLNNLEERFKQNERSRLPHKGRIIKCIDLCLVSKRPMTKSAFIQELNLLGIEVIFRHNEDGRIYGITFIDNKTKTVFNGSALGKQYTAKAITDRLSNLSAPDPSFRHPTSFLYQKDESVDLDLGFEHMIKDLTVSNQYDFSSTYEAKKRQRKKKRKKRSK